MLSQYTGTRRADPPFSVCVPNSYLSILVKICLNNHLSVLVFPSYKHNRYRFLFACAPRSSCRSMIYHTSIGVKQTQNGGNGILDSTRFIFIHLKNQYLLSPIIVQIMTLFHVGTTTEGREWMIIKQFIYYLIRYRATSSLGFE